MIFFWHIFFWHFWNTNLIKKKTFESEILLIGKKEEVTPSLEIRNAWETFLKLLCKS